MMSDGIPNDRLLNMSALEKRWFQNVKKGFYKSDLAYQEGRAHDDCFPEICKAIDTAKTLNRSLRGESVSSANHKQQFLEFLKRALPSGNQIQLVDARNNKSVKYSLPEMVFCIRCMIHENENLNAAEKPDYHVLIDWTMGQSALIGTIINGRVTCNGHVIWRRLREIMASFITGIDGRISFATNKSFFFSASPPLGSIRPS
jgi:hypothetical protein